MCSKLDYLSIARSLELIGEKFSILKIKKIGVGFMLYLLYFQYLTKRNIKDIGRENFSFSCKVIVGEYILFKDDEDGSKVRYNFV